jgi:hypothetical protein
MSIEIQNEVEQFLRSIVMYYEQANRKYPTDFQYRCIEDFVLKNGRHMGRRCIGSNQYPQGEMKQCYRNAFNLLELDPYLIYCEGYATTGLLPVLHAWCIDPKGNIIDNTWNEGICYFGVPFNKIYVLKAVTQQGKYGVIDNWKNSWPLLRGEKGWEVGNLCQ